MTPDLTLVEALAGVVDTGSFGGAARALGRSQPTVSQQVARLEAEVGTTLLVRRRDRCLLTADGELFLASARRALTAARHAVEAVQHRRLAIGASTNPGSYLLPRHVARAATGAELRLGTNPETIARLSAGEVDVAFLEWWDQRPGFDAAVWREEEMVIIVAPEHRWARRRNLPLSALVEEELIGGEPGTGTGRLLAEALGAAAASLQVTRQLGSTDAVKQAVAAGLGVSIVMRATTHDAVAAGALVAIPVTQPRLSRAIYAVLPSEAPGHAPARQFLAATAMPPAPDPSRLARWRPQ